MKLTRFLYQFGEVKHSLIYSVLKKTSFNECLFWTSEFYYSGYFLELWKLIWKIYYDFYALSYPKMERKIKQYYKLWKNDKQFINIMHIVKNFFRFSFSSNSCIFMLRIYYYKRLFKLLDKIE